MNNRSRNIKLLAVTGLLVVALAYIMVWRPKASDLADAKQTNGELTDQLAGLRAAAAAPAVSTTVDPTAKALRLAVPETADLANLLRQFSTVAERTGVNQKLVSPSPATAIAGTSGSSVTVTISATGTKAALYAYVHQLSGLSRLFVVDKISLQAAGAAAASADSGGPTQTAAPSAGTGLEQLDLTGRVFVSTSARSAGGTDA
jgi:Tfp pilus assembly protein PilO